MCCASFSYAAEITGTWKAIDDKTGYARADVEISKLNDGTYQGKSFVSMLFQIVLHIPIALNVRGTERRTYSGSICLIRSKTKSRKEK